MRFLRFSRSCWRLVDQNRRQEDELSIQQEVWVNDMTLDGNNNQTLEKIHPPGFESWPFLADSTLSHGSHVKQRPVAVSLDNFSIKIRHSPDE